MLHTRLWDWALSDRSTWHPTHWLICAQVRAACWSPDGSVAASGGDDKLVKVWDVEAAKAMVRAEIKVRAPHAIEAITLLTA